MSADNIAEISLNYWGSNFELAKNLIHQQADTAVGFFLFFLVFILQMINFLWPLTLADLGVDYFGFVLGVIVTVAVWICADLVHRRCRNKKEEEVRVIILQRLGPSNPFAPQ